MSGYIGISGDFPTYTTVTEAVTSSNLNDLFSIAHDTYHFEFDSSNNRFESTNPHLIKGSANTYLTAKEDLTNATINIYTSAYSTSSDAVVKLYLNSLQISQASSKSIVSWSGNINKDDILQLSFVFNSSMPGNVYTAYVSIPSVTYTKQTGTEYRTDKAAKIKSLYIGINGLAKKVNKAYIGVNGMAKKWFGDASIDPTDPNTRYESKSICTWSSLSDVNIFFNTYNHDNNYTGLSLGNYIKINDGTYNKYWEIAGFDMEHNQTAADGTVYDNGYGICMIPRTYLMEEKWDNVYRTSAPPNGYYGSYIHNTVLNTAIKNNISNILGSHFINRNTLLSSALKTPQQRESSAYTWTTAYLTLMSVGQLTGTFASHTNKYDDGESNYKLPLFNYEDIKIEQGFWTRCIGGGGLTRNTIFIIDKDGNVTFSRIAMDEETFFTGAIRPMMYLS